MYEAFLSFANYAFFVLHFGLMAFSMVGWAFRSTRVWQLVAMLLTAASWFILGPILYGIPGVCVCTVWHNNIRYALGLDPQLNFVQMLGHEWFGVVMSIETSERIALSIFVLILLAMIWTWGTLGYRRWCSCPQDNPAEPAALEGFSVPEKN